MKNGWQSSCSRNTSKTFRSWTRRLRLWTENTGSSIWLCTICQRLQKQMTMVRKHLFHSWTSVCLMAASMKVWNGSLVHTTQIRRGHVRYMCTPCQRLTRTLLKHAKYLKEINLICDTDLIRVQQKPRQDMSADFDTLKSKVHKPITERFH